MTDGCRLRLFIVDNRRLILPTPPLSPLASSLIIFCVLGRGFAFGIVGSVPALKCRSSMNSSRSDANFLSADSKSSSLMPLGALTGPPWSVN